MTDLDIINHALYRLGESVITSVDEGTPTADLCKALYPSVRDTLLSWQAWPFATVRQSLVRLPATPVSDYLYYYRAPVNPVFLRGINNALHDFDFPYQREVWVNPLDPNEQIPVFATEALEFTLRYVGRTASAVWSPLFCACLEVYLAQALAPSITGKASLKESLLTELYGARGVAGLLVKLRDVSGHEDSPQAIPYPTAYEQVRDGHAGAWTTVGGWR